MADGGGYSHFQQPGPRNFVPFARVGRGSPPRQNDTPSPSRSPGIQSSGGYNLFGQPQQQQGHSQHVLLNGTGGPSHQRYTMQMNLAHKFQQQQQHQQAQQQQPSQPSQQQQKQQQQQQQQQSQQQQKQQLQQQQPPLAQQQQQQTISQPMHSHQQLQQQLQQNQQNQQNIDPIQIPGAGNTNGAPGNVLGHQHTFSNPPPTTTFGSPQQLANGNTGSGTSVNVPQHWQEQMALYQSSRQSGSPHHNARVAAAKTRSVQAGSVMNLSSLMTMQIEDNEDTNPDEERRPAMQSTSDKDKRQDWIALDFGGQGLRALSETLFAYAFLDKLFINHNKLTSLPAAIGKLKLLSHLDASSNSLTDLPAELGLLTNLRYLLLFDNRISQLPGELGTLFQLEVLGIEGNPLNEATKMRMMKEGTKACIHYLRENCSITLPPVVREWNILDGSAEKTDPSKENEKFSVISYNVLCDKYATPAAYGYTASWALAWEYRRNIILEEVQNHKGDIVCLQEVDMGSFEDYFSPNLAYDNFKGVFFPKARARNMSAVEQKTVDGCATFYKSTKFNLLDKQVIDITRAALNRADMKKTTDIFNRVMPRDNVSTVVYLENKKTGVRLIVANVHLHWDPAYRDVKIVQTTLLLEELTKLADRYAADPPMSKNVGVDGAKAVPPVKYPNGASIPLLICGDFNSTADSGVYELLSRGSIPPNHNELDGRDYGNVSRDGVVHPFSLKSAYSHIGELSWTTYTPGFVGTIDYIWYSTAAMQVTGLLGDVDKSYIERVAGIPNVHFPSDHLLILSEFMFKQARKEIAKPPPPDFGSTSRK